MTMRPQGGTVKPQKANEPLRERRHQVARRRRRYQAGCLFKRGKRRKVWVARWWEDVLLEGGQLGRLHRSVVLGTVAELPTRRDALSKLEEQIRPVNQGTTRPEASMSFGVFA